MKCLKCRNEIPEGSKFCKECWAKIELSCPNCSKTIPADSKFCPECGYNLRKPEAPKIIDYQQPQSYTPKHLADKILTTRSAIEGERKIVTVMFADVAGFSSMSEKLDPEEVVILKRVCFIE